MGNFVSMKPQKWYICMLLLSAMIFAGCNGSQRLDRRLQDVEAGFQINPDSMVRVLVSMDTLTLNERSKAQRALMITRARSKNHERQTDDSLIRYANEYFEKNGPDYERMLSKFYVGEIAVYRNEPVRAMRVSEEALKLANKLKDVYWQARLYQQIADVFAITYNQYDEIPTRIKAIDLFRKSGYEANVQYAQLDLTLAYVNNLEYDKCISILDSLIPMVRLTGDTFLLGECYSSRALAHIGSGRYIKAAADVDSAFKYLPDRSIKNQEYVAIAECSLYTGDSLKAKKYIPLALESAVDEADTVRTYGLLINYYDKLKDYKSALKYESKVLKINNRQIAYLLQQSGVKVQRELRESEAIEAKEIAERRGTIILIITLSSLVIILTLNQLFRERIRRKNAELSAAMSELRRRAEEYIVDTANDQRVIGDILQEQWKTINNICVSYSKFRESEIRDRIYRELEKEFARLREPSLLRQTEEAVNMTKNGIVKRFREQCGDIIKPKEWEFIIFLFARIPIQAIAAIIDVNSKTLYTRRSRLIKKLLDSDAPDREEFVREL